MFRNDDSWHDFVRDHVIPANPCPEGVEWAAKLPKDATILDGMSAPADVEFAAWALWVFRHKITPEMRQALWDHMHQNSPLMFKLYRGLKPMLTTKEKADMKRWHPNSVGDKKRG